MIATSASCLPPSITPRRSAGEAERAFLQAVQGGCQIPAGAYAEVNGDGVALTAVLCSLDGRQVLRAERRGEDGVALARRVARELLEAGGQAVLDGIRRTGRSPRQPELSVM